MLYTDNTTKLLGLKDVIVKNIEEKKDEYMIDIELPRRNHICPVCGCNTDRIHDYRKQVIKDISAFGKKTILNLRKRRYICPKCGKRFFEDISFLPKYHRMTNRAVAHIIESFRSLTSATEIAKKNNISTTTVIRYFNLVNYQCNSLPEVLSIDEFKGNANGEKYQTIITDAKHHKVKDILPNRKENDLKTYFNNFSTKNSVKLVVIDMNPHFLRVAKSCFPNADVIVDKFHVVRQVIRDFENVRRNEQKTMSKRWRKFFKRSKSLLNKLPSTLSDDEKDQVSVMLSMNERIRDAYLIKNEFLKFIKSENSVEARNRLSKWVMHTEIANIPEFKASLTAIHNWDKYILNAFDFPYTNGFTEGCNNKIKVLKRVSFGIVNFERFRNRILHAFA